MGISDSGAVNVYLSEAPECTPNFCGARVSQSLVCYEFLL